MSPLRGSGTLVAFTRTYARDHRNVAPPGLRDILSPSPGLTPGPIGMPPLRGSWAGDEMYVGDEMHTGGHARA
jgi:hypothetical protein